MMLLFQTIPGGYADIRQPAQPNKILHNKPHKLLRLESVLHLTEKSISELTACCSVLFRLCAIVCLHPSTFHIPRKSYMPKVSAAAVPSLSLLQQPHSFRFSTLFYSSSSFFLIYAQHTKHSILAVSAVAEIAVNEKRSPFIFFILPLLSVCSL